VSRGIEPFWIDPGNHLQNVVDGVAGVEHSGVRIFEGRCRGADLPVGHIVRIRELAVGVVRDDRKAGVHVRKVFRIPLPLEIGSESIAYEWRDPRRGDEDARDRHRRHLAWEINPDPAELFAVLQRYPMDNDPSVHGSGGTQGRESAQGLILRCRRRWRSRLNGLAASQQPYDEEQREGEVS
jgi:hypothetical protein